MQREERKEKLFSVSLLLLDSSDSDWINFTLHPFTLLSLSLILFLSFFLPLPLAVFLLLALVCAHGLSIRCHSCRLRPRRSGPSSAANATQKLSGARRGKCCCCSGFLHFIRGKIRLVSLQTYGGDTSVPPEPRWAKAKLS